MATQKTTVCDTCGKTVSYDDRSNHAPYPWISVMVTIGPEDAGLRMVARDFCQWECLRAHVNWTRNEASA